MAPAGGIRALRALALVFLFSSGRKPENFFLTV